MLKVAREARLQPKTGVQKRSRLQSIGLSQQDTGSCEQAPAYYTSMRPSAHQCETVVALDWHQIHKVLQNEQHDSRQKAPRAQGLEGELQSAAHGLAHDVAGGRQAPGISRPLPAGSSGCTMHMVVKGW